MKTYAILLAVLFGATLIKNAMLLQAGAEPLMMLLYILQPASYAACVYGAWARARGRKVFEPEIWRAVWMATLGLAIAMIALRAFGSRWGLQPAGVETNFLELAMTGLIAGLFAAPIIQYEQELRGNLKD